MRSAVTYLVGRNLSSTFASLFSLSNSFSSSSINFLRDSSDVTARSPVVACDLISLKSQPDMLNAVIIITENKREVN